MRISLVDVCGGQFQNTHGSIHIYDVEEDSIDRSRLYSLPPEQTIQKIQELQESGDAELVKTIDAGDVITV